jgi:putative ABC transport system permease protein
VFLIAAPAASVEQVSTELEDRLSDFGFDVVATLERLAGFHQVENTYLSTFQSLGALGLVLGTIGLGVILLRNVLERRRELALLRAVGYRPSHVGLVVIAESAFLLASGVVIGTVTAILAITPALLSRGGSFSGRSLALLLTAVLFSGLLSSLVAARAAVRSPLLESLRQE